MIYAFLFGAVCVALTVSEHFVVVKLLLVAQGALAGRGALLLLDRWRLVRRVQRLLAIENQGKVPSVRAVMTFLSRSRNTLAMDLARIKPGLALRLPYDSFQKRVLLTSALEHARVPFEIAPIDETTMLAPRHLTTTLSPQQYQHYVKVVRRHRL